MSNPKRPAIWKPATLEEVTDVVIREKFFDTKLEEPVRAPVSVSVAGGAVRRDSPEWAAYEADRKADQLDLSLAGGGGSGSGGGGGGGHEEERKTSYGLPTEEEIRAVLMRVRSGASAGVGVVGMTRKQLEMTLQGDRPAMKLGLRERLDEVIGRKGLAVEGQDRLVWRGEE